MANCGQSFLFLVCLLWLQCVGSKLYAESLWSESGECNSRISSMVISWSSKIEVQLSPPVYTSEYVPVCEMVAEFNDTTASGLHISSQGRTVCMTEIVITASCRQRLICYRKEILCGSTLIDEYWEDAYKIYVSVTSLHAGMGDESKPLRLSVATVYNMNGEAKKGLGKGLIYVIIAAVIVVVLVFIAVPLCMRFCCTYSRQSANIQQPAVNDGTSRVEGYASDKFRLGGTYKQHGHQL